MRKQLISKLPMFEEPNKSLAILIQESHIKRKALEELRKNAF